MKTTDLILILASVVLSATAQLLLKLGATAPVVRAAMAGDGALAGRALALMTTPTLVGGLAVYALSAGFWIAVLSRVDLSLAYPFVGLGFVLTFLIGTFFLGETANAARLTGTLLIMVGAVLVARSA